MFLKNISRSYKSELPRVVLFHSLGPAIRPLAPVHVITTKIPKLFWQPWWSNVWLGATALNPGIHTTFQSSIIVTASFMIWCNHITKSLHVLYCKFRLLTSEPTTLMPIQKNSLVEFRQNTRGFNVECQANQTQILLKYRKESNCSEVYQRQ